MPTGSGVTLGQVVNLPGERGALDWPIALGILRDAGAEINRIALSSSVSRAPLAWSEGV